MGLWPHVSMLVSILNCDHYLSDDHYSHQVMITISAIRDDHNYHHAVITTIVMCNSTINNFIVITTTVMAINH